MKKPKLIGRIYRRMVYRHKSRQGLYDYWRHPDDDNLPSDYLKNAAPRSLFLVGVMEKHVPKTAKILEIGCNVGRNLDYLYKAGFTRLEGIEINNEAVRLSREAYPEMTKHTHIHNHPVEDVIPSFNDNEFDVIFTMAVLEHIHKDSQWVFKEMVRTSNTIITIEDEHGMSERHFPRNYKKVFERLGMKQVDDIDCSSVEGLGSCHCRVFIRR